MDKENDVAQKPFMWWDKSGVPCDACGNIQPNTQQDKLPDGGWVLPLESLGYYGGFDDNIGVQIGGDEPTWISFCHDCVVKFLETFPAIAAKMSGGCHPNFIHDRDFRWRENGNTDGTIFPSCCRWAWTWVETGSRKDGNRKVDTYYGDGNGGWVLAHKGNE